MNVGEIFIQLGIRGKDEAFKALTSIKSTLTDMSAAGIAAKASILGAVYALEQFSVQSANYGNNLQNFSTLTGESVVKTQQLAEAIREMTHSSRGEGTQEAENFIKGFQTKISQWRMSGTPIGDFAHIFAAQAGYDLNQNDPFKLFQAIQRFRQSSKLSKAEQNAILEGMGISPSIIITAEKFKGDITRIVRGIESPGMLQALDNVKGQWSDFWKSLNDMRDTVVAKYGQSIIGTLAKDVQYLADLMDKLIKKSEEFSKTPVGKQLKSILESQSKGNSYDTSGDVFFNHDPAEDVLKSFIRSWIESIKPKVRAYLDEDFRNFMSSPTSSPTPSPAPGRHGSINVNVNQYGVKDSFDGIDQHRNEVARAYYSIATIGQVA